MVLKVVGDYYGLLKVSLRCVLDVEQHKQTNSCKAIISLVCLQI